MDDKEIAAQKTALLSNIFMYESDAPLMPEAFLHRAWDVLSRFVHWNKQNPLIRDAVKRYPDLIPRGYHILTVLYNAYGYVPPTKALLKDFVNEILDDDLDEYELRVYEYAKYPRNGFLSGLSEVMPMIREVYGAKHFNLEVLPPAPYHAYVFFTLHHQEKIGQRITPEECFGILSIHDSQMKEIFKLVGRETGSK